MANSIELTDSERADLTEIQRLHDEAFLNYMKHGDGHHKSSEGSVEVSYGNFWERESGKRPTCAVYSYVFGASRLNHFDTIGAALTDVKKWHADEQAYDYSAEAD